MLTPKGAIDDRDGLLLVDPTGDDIIRQVIRSVDLANHRTRTRRLEVAAVDPRRGVNIAGWPHAIAGDPKGWFWHAAPIDLSTPSFAKLTFLGVAWVTLGRHKAVRIVAGRAYRKDVYSEFDYFDGSHRAYRPYPFGRLVWGYGPELEYPSESYVVPGFFQIRHQLSELRHLGRDETFWRLWHGVRDNVLDVGHWSALHDRLVDMDPPGYDYRKTAVRGVVETLKEYTDNPMTMWDKP